MKYGIQLPINTPSFERGRLEYQKKFGRVITFIDKEEALAWEDTQGNKILVGSTHPMVRAYRKERK